MSDRLTGKEVVCFGDIPIGSKFQFATAIALYGDADAATYRRVGTTYYRCVVYERMMAEYSWFEGKYCTLNVLDWHDSEVIRGCEAGRGVVLVAEQIKIGYSAPAVVAPVSVPITREQWIIGRGEYSDCTLEFCCDTMSEAVKLCDELNALGVCPYEGKYHLVKSVDMIGEHNKERLLKWHSERLQEERELDNERDAR